MKRGFHFSPFVICSHGMVFLWPGECFGTSEMVSLHLIVPQWQPSVMLCYGCQRSEVWKSCSLWSSRLTTRRSGTLVWERTEVFKLDCTMDHQSGEGAKLWAETLVGAVVEERRSFHFGKEARTVAGEAQTPAPSLHTLSCSQTRTVCSQHKSQKEASVCKSALRTRPSGDTPHAWPGSCSFHTNQSLLVEVFVKGWPTVMHWHGIHGLREVNFLTVPAGLNIVAVWRSQWNAYLRQMPEDVLIAPCANVRFLLFRKLSLWDWGSFNWGKFCLSELDE